MHLFGFYCKNKKPNLKFTFCKCEMTDQVAMRSKAWVCVRSRAEIAG